jgi:hypothetical protein
MTAPWATAARPELKQHAAPTYVRRYERGCGLCVRRWFPSPQKRRTRQPRSDSSGSPRFSVFPPQVRYAPNHLLSARTPVPVVPNQGYDVLKYRLERPAAPTARLLDAFEYRLVGQKFCSLGPAPPGVGTPLSAWCWDAAVAQRRSSLGALWRCRPLHQARGWRRYELALVCASCLAATDRQNIGGPHTDDAFSVGPICSRPRPPRHRGRIGRNAP